MTKYRNIKQSGYDSKKEHRRANDLKLLQRAGRISDLREQVKFVLQDGFRHNGKAYRSITYIADFVYTQDGKKVVEDVKSEITKKLPVYSMKKKMLLFKYPEIVFIET